MTTIVWFCIGLFLLIAEMVSFTLWALFFSFGAFTVWLLLYFNIITDRIEVQVIAFALFSLIYAFFLRKYFKKLTQVKNAEEENGFAGKVVNCVEEFSAENKFQGKVEHNGAIWKATSNDEAIAKDEKVFIVERKNITLVVSKNKKD